MYESSPPHPSRSRTLHSASSDPDPLADASAPDPAQHLHPNNSNPTSHPPPPNLHLPPQFLERGAVTSSAEMTTQYSDAEWDAIVADVWAELGGDEAEAEAEAEEEIEGAEGRESVGPPVTNLAATIDHTLLKVDAKPEQFEVLCAEARREGFASVCVRPPYVAACQTHLTTSRPSPPTSNLPAVRISSVIGFPEGTHPLASKLAEVSLSLAAGAAELDVVLNWPLLRRGALAAVYHELAAIRTQAPAALRGEQTGKGESASGRPESGASPAATASGTTLKLILETSQLSRREIVAGCVLAHAAGWEFVKTSTGFCGGGATERDVGLMGRVCGVLDEQQRRKGRGVRDRMCVKASGGIRTFEQARAMLGAGAERLGTSAGVEIVREERERAGVSSRAAVGGGGREKSEVEGGY